jgi:hypothetical protein
LLLHVQGSNRLRSFHDGPTNHSEQFKDLVLPLSPTAQFKEIDPALPIHQIEHILHNTRTATLDKMALRAFVFARQHLVVQRKVEDVRGLLDVWKRGGRGYQVSICPLNPNNMGSKV